MTDQTPPLPEGFALEAAPPPPPEGFRLEGAGTPQQPSLGGKVMEETRRAIAQADRDYIVPMLGLPADIVGWALDTEKDLPGSTAWWRGLPGIGDVPEPETRAGKLGAEVLGQGASGVVQGGAIGKGLQAGGQVLGAAGRAVASKIGGQIADPAANAASALGSAAAGQGLGALAPEGLEPLAHGVGSVLGGALGGGFTASPRALSAIDKAFDAYERLGLHPSASMVGVGGRTAQVLEGNVLPSALGSANKMHNFATQTLDKFQSIKDNIASQFGASRTKYGMGKDVQDIVEQGFQARKKEGGDILNAVGQAFGPNDRFIPKNLNNALFKPKGTAEAEEAVQKYANDPELAKIKAILDATGGSLTYAGMLGIKSKLGNMLEQSHAVAVDKAQIGQLVSAIDNDMKSAVESIGNPDIVKDWERGKAIYNNAMRDYERSFKDLLGKKDLPINPESVYRIMMGNASTKASEDIKSFETVWRQLGKAKQGELASTVLTQMGNTNPEKLGSVDGFSLNTFLTQYKNLSPPAKQMLFRSTGNQQLEKSLDDLLFAADRIGGWDKVASTSRSNISGTMMGQAGALASVAATGDWLKALAFGVMDIGGPSAAAWALTNPKGIRAIASALDKANDAAVGAMRGVMAINPPRAPGLNIPNRPPQENPGGGNTIPSFAEGGIVTKPTVAMIGEKGPEMVVPLTEKGMGNVGGGFNRSPGGMGGIAKNPLEMGGGLRQGLGQLGKKVGQWEQQAQGRQQNVMSEFQNMEGMFGNWLQQLMSKFPGAEAALAKYGIPGLADGGVVTEPTVAMLGEKGPEAVIPLDPAMVQQASPVQGAQPAMPSLESALPQEPSNLLADASPQDQAMQAREAAAMRQQHAVQPPGGRQQGEFTEGLLDLAIPGRSIGRAIGQGEYGEAAVQAGMQAIPFAGKALSTAARAAPGLTKTVGAATGALTGLLTGSEAGKIPLDPEQRKRLQMEQQSLKQKQDAANAAAQQRLQEAEQKARIDSEAAERSAKTETERQKALAEIENNKQREQAEIVAKRHKEEEDAAQRSLDAAKAEAKRMAERPFREIHPEAALGMTLGGMAVAAMLPTLSNAQKAAALNKYVKEWKQLDSAAAEALKSGTAQEKQIAVQRLSDASNKWVETKDRLSAPSSIGTKLAYGMAGAEGAALPAEIDFGLQPKGSEAHKSAEEFFTNPMEMARVVATYLGGTMAGMTASKYPFRTAEPPVGSGGLIAAYGQQQAAEKKAATAAKSAETRAKKKAEAEKAPKKEPEKEEPRKAKVPRGGPKIYGLREE